MDQDHVLRRAGLRVPDPLFGTTIPAGRPSSCPTPLPPGGQPDPQHSGEGAGPLRWARCPDDGSLHLLQSAQVLLAAAGYDAQTLCGQQVPVEALTITTSSAGTLCMACVVGVPAERQDLDPRGTAPRSLAGRRWSVDPPGLPAAGQPPANPAPPAQPTADPWRDAEGTHIPLQSRVEQAVVDTQHGALPCRLHHQGQVIGRGTTLVYVHFERENQMIALLPHLVRVLETPDGC